VTEAYAVIVRPTVALVAAVIALICTTVTFVVAVLVVSSADFAVIVTLPPVEGAVQYVFWLFVVGLMLNDPPPDQVMFPVFPPLTGALNVVVLLLAAIIVALAVIVPNTTVCGVTATELSA